MECCRSSWIGLFALLLAVVDNNVLALEKEYTISLDAGKTTCFYEVLDVNEVFDIEYQVIDGGHGDLDISFELSEPEGRVLYADFKKSDNVHRHQAMHSGAYRFCFDNTFSLWSRKTVFFELVIEKEDGSRRDGEEEEHIGWNGNSLEGLTPEEFYDMKIEDIQSAIGRVRAHLTKARQTQDLLKSFEARDRNVAEANYFRVNAWSVFQIVMMLCVGCLQVFMVRSLFETDSSKMTIWKRLCFL